MRLFPKPSREEGIGGIVLGFIGMLVIIGAVVVATGGGA